MKSLFEYLQFLENTAELCRAEFYDCNVKSDSAKINVTEIFKIITPNTTVKVV